MIKLSPQAPKEEPKIDKQDLKRGIVRDGQRYYPDLRLLGSKKYGVEWTEGVAEALSRNEAQGKFSTLEDVYFAVQKGAELGPGKSGVFHLPSNSSAIVYVPKQIGEQLVVEIQPAKYLYVKVSPNGKVFAYPSLTVKPAPRVRYVEKPDPIELALKYRKIAALADEVPKIAQTTRVSEDIIAAVKEHLFLTKHTVQIGATKEVEAFFTPDDTIADLWFKALDGTLSTVEEALFKRTLAHEYVERGLMKAGLPYRSRAKESWSLNGEAVSEPTSAHYGAHDLAPHQDAKKPPFFLWEKRFNLPADGLMLADDLSNLDEVIEEILRRVERPKGDV